MTSKGPVCMCFNSLMLFCIYREESSLVDQFVFEVLVVFVESLALAHSDEQSMGNNYSCFIHRNFRFWKNIAITNYIWII